MIEQVKKVLPMSSLTCRKSYRLMKTISCHIYTSPRRSVGLINITFASVKDRREEYMNFLSYAIGVLLNVKCGLNTQLVNTILADLRADWYLVDITRILIVSDIPLANVYINIFFRFNIN